jgi:putative transcriptional regulator
MAIIINIDVMLAKRKMSVTELAERVGITMANISILKNGKAKAIRLSTLEAICKALNCQPGDILEYLDQVDHRRRSGHESRLQPSSVGSAADYRS